MPELLDLRFFVPGRVVPKGNHAAFPIARGKCECKGRGCRRRNCFGGTLVGTVITDDGGDELKAWEAFVRAHAISARNRDGVKIVDRPGSIEIRLVFLFPRPQGHWTTRGQLSADGLRHPLPSVKPDWDKVSRSTADGLTEGLVVDDSQIVMAMVAKEYSERGPGVIIHARQISQHSTWVHDELRAVGLAPVAQQAGLFG